MGLLLKILTVVILMLLIRLALDWPIAGRWMDRKLRPVRPGIRWALMPLVAVIAAAICWLLLFLFGMWAMPDMEGTIGTAYIVMCMAFPSLVFVGSAAAFAPSGKRIVCLTTAVLLVPLWDAHFLLMEPTEPQHLWALQAVVLPVAYVVWRLVSYSPKDTK
jgi:hypothetical protein